MRIHELGKELGIDNKQIIDFLAKEGVKVSAPSSAVPEKMIERVRAHFSRQDKTAGMGGNIAVAVPDFIIRQQEEKERAEADRKADELKKKQEKENKEEVVPSEEPKKKKIVSVFNPQHSETTQGKAAAQQRARMQGQDRRDPSRQPTKRIPAKDRRPSDEPLTPPRKLPSQIRPARERMSDDEIEELKRKKAEQEAAKKAAEEAAAQEAAKKAAEEAAKKAEEAAKAVQETPVNTITEPKAESKETVDKKPMEKNVEEKKPEAPKAPVKEPAKPEIKIAPKPGESEAAKSLRDKIVKGTVNITDIPVKASKGDKNKRKGKDGKDARPSGKDGRDNRDNRDARDNKPGKDNRPGAKNAGSAAAPASTERRDSGRGKGKFNKHDKSQGDKFDRLENEKAAQKVVKQQQKPEPVEEEVKVITLPETISIKDFAAKLKMQPAALIKTLFLKGKVYTVNDILDFETAEDIALSFDILSEHEVVIDYIEELLAEEEDPPESLKKRPPVVCVMGHVDHGKTSLLDAIRKTNVIQGEAGGITQHIGAYTVEINGESITFLDTPGHEAFTAMRLRGAQATDVAILVVAADDGVMPQTIEAINHAKAANIHVIVAVNKIDKPGANIPKVMQELSDQGLVPEDWGGDTIFVPISAKTGEGIENLLEMVILGTEILELKANPDRMARGIVIEAKLDKGRGSVATLLVQKGTLKVGDHIAMGEAYGKVRSMTDDKGQRVKKAGPSTPVEITGLSGVPNAGEVFVAFDNDKEAKHFAQVYIEENKKKLLAGTKSKMNLDDVFDQMKAGELKELNIVIKADVQGSAEAMKESLEKISNDEVIVKVIHSGVGNVSESDAVLASASNAIIIAFNVGVNADAKATIDREKVDLRSYKVIYNAIDDVELAMKGMLEPIYEEVITGHVEVRQTFKASGVGIIAGSYVTDGVVKRDSKIRLFREGEMIYEGQVASLKRFNDDAKEVRSGYECGIVLNDNSDIKEGDTMEAYEMKEVPRV